MQVILREDVSNLGRSGELVTVRDGYGRNYLVPRGLAVVANARNVGRLEHEKRVISQRERKLLKRAETVKQRIEEISLTIAKQTGEQEKLFGSVTTREISAALKEQGVEVDRKRILVEEPIKTLGLHTVQVRLAGDLQAALKVWVVAAD